MITHYRHTLRLFSRNARLFLLANACIGFGYFGIYALLLNLYLLRLGYGPQFVGLVNSAGPLSLAIFSLPSGALSRRWGSRRALIVSFGMMALGLGLLPFGEFLPLAGRAGWLMATYMLVWLCGGLFMVNAGPFLMGATTPPERDHVFSMQAALLPVAGFAGNLIGGLLPGLFAALLGVGLDHPAPYRYLLWLAAAFYLPALLLMRATSVAKMDSAQQPVAGAMKAPIMLILVLAAVTLLRTAGEWAMRIFFNVYLDSALHVPTPWIGALSAAGQLLGIAALAAPLLIRQWGHRTIVGWGTLGMACTLLPLVFLAHWSAVGIGFMGMMAVVALTNPSLNVFRLESVPARWHTTMGGATTMAFGIGIAAIAFGGGYLIVLLGYRMLFLASALLTVAGAVLFFAYFRPAHKEQAHTPVAKVIAAR